LTVTIKKIGGSVAVLIPKAVAQEMGLIDGTPLEISNTADALVMRKRGRRQRRSMRKIVEQIKPASYQRRNRDILEDGAVGKEIW
jgi:antitoxin component of MazEF toxin-antitoxin module